MPSWRDELPDDLKEHVGLKDVKDIGGLAKQFIDGQAALGTSIRIPGPEAGADALKAFHTKLSDKVPGLIPTPDPENAEIMSALYNKMGRPEAATGYKHPEGFDATQMTQFATKAHELGLTNSQYLGLVTELQTHTVARDESNTEAFNTAQRALKQEWGIVYEDNLQLVDAVMKGTGAPKEMLELAANGKLPPEAARWLHQIGTQLGTEGVNFKKDEFSSRVAPAEAAQRAAEMIGDRKGPYWDSGHPEHANYVKRYVELMRAANPGG